MLIFFLIGNQKTNINEKKKGRVHVVHDDEQQEKYKTKSKKEGNQETIIRENINSEREE